MSAKDEMKLAYDIETILRSPQDLQEKIKDIYGVLLNIAAGSQKPPKPRQPTLRYFLSEEAVLAGLQPPNRAYADDAGFDLRVLSAEPIVIPPHERRAIPTGTGFEVPSGWYGLICNRTSGGKKGLIPLAQVVDASFTGFLTLTLHNTNAEESLTLNPGDRVAQIVFMPVWSLPIERIEPDQVKKTDRGVGAYGSSGI